MDYSTLTITLFTLAATTVVSALNLAFLQVSASALREAFERRGMRAEGTWVAQHEDTLESASALARAFGRIGFFALALLTQSVGGAMPSASVIAWTVFFCGLGLWFFTGLLAAALARHAAARLIVAFYWPMRALHLVCYPLTVLGRPVDEVVRRLVGGMGLRDAAEVQLLHTIEDSQRSGGLDVVSAEILENVVQFSGQPVSGVMTPRTEVEGLEYTDDLSAVREAIHRAGHSRIPVFVGSLDSIVGILYLRDLVTYLGEDAPQFTLRDHLRQPIRVPETKPVQDLLLEFQRSEVHMAIVVDEFGGTAGLVTIEDALEEIVGEITDEHEGEDSAEPGAQQRPDGGWLVDGAFRVDEFAEASGLPLPQSEAFDTVAGLALAQLGSVGAVGESFVCHRARWEIAAATPTRIERLLVRPLDSTGQSNSSPRNVDAR